MANISSEVGLSDVILRHVLAVPAEESDVELQNEAVSRCGPGYCNNVFNLNVLCGCRWWAGSKAALTSVLLVITRRPVWAVVPI